MMPDPSETNRAGGAPAQPVRGAAPAAGRGAELDGATAHPGPAQQGGAPDGSAGRGGAQPREDDLWAAVEAHWEDPAAHKTYLAQFPDLDGLTVAGRRYRAVLEARPGDAVALAMKGEVLKRATVVGMAMLPRSTPAPLVGGKWKRRLILLAASWLASTVAWLAWKLFGGSTP
jgi:hypothetical protein